jgi:hypothetical protein
VNLGGGSPDISKAVEADCATVLENQTATHITGLDRLEGETVVVTVAGILSSGGVNGRYVVVSGAIDVSDVPPAGATVVVGLEYETTIEPNRIDADNRQGITQGLVKAVGRVNLRVHNSRGGTVAAGARAKAVPIKYDGLTAVGGVYTGDVELESLGDHGLDVPIVIRQSDPYPLNILAVIPRYDITGTP